MYRHDSSHCMRLRKDGSLRTVQVHLTHERVHSENCAAQAPLINILA